MLVMEVSYLFLGNFCLYNRPVRSALGLVQIFIILRRFMLMVLLQREWTHSILVRL